MDERLIRILNESTTIAIVGAGAACDAGLPTGKALAALVKDRCGAENKGDQDRLKTLFEEAKFPELFAEAANALGETALYAFIESKLKPQRESEVHKILATLPFAFYITTNYDDLLLGALRQQKQAFSKLLNSNAELSSISADTRNVVVKLHGDFSAPGSVIITSEHYRKLRSSPDYEYLREKLDQIIGMFNVVVIGYSFSDPHLTSILERAQFTFKFGRPVFTILSDARAGDAEELKKAYNVEVLTYKTVNGSHARLLSMLKNLDVFVRDRSHKPIGLTLPTAQENADANQLFLFSTFHVRGEAVDFKLSSFKSLIVSALEAAVVPKSVSEILSSLPFGVAKITDKTKPLTDLAIESLVAEGVISNIDGQLELVKKGRESVEAAGLRYKQAVERFKEQALIDLRASVKQVDSKTEELFIRQLVDCVNAIFYQRGLEMAGAIFGQGPVVTKGTLDIFRTTKEFASKFSDQEHWLYFVEYLQTLVSKPKDTQVDYLWHLAQAYFAYQALNLDPACRAVQQSVLKEKGFILDSNILLPFLARGCFNHEATVELFELIKSIGVRVFITDMMLAEVAGHAEYALGLAKRVGARSGEFLKAALGKGDYRQNLFIDGFVRSASMQNVEFEDYITGIFGSGGPAQWKKTILVKLPQLLVISPQAIFSAEQHEEVESVSNKIRAYRQGRGTYREDAQCLAEAQIFQIIAALRETGTIPDKAFDKILDLRFISQSRVLDFFNGGGKVDRDPQKVWRTETFYRYLSCFSRGVPEKGIWQQFVASEVYQRGISVIDEERYRTYFGSTINQARMDFDLQKRYLSRVANEEFAERASLEFAATPELEQPMLVESLGRHLERLLAGSKILTAKEKGELEKYRTKDKARRDYIRWQKARKRRT